MTKLISGALALALAGAVAIEAQAQAQKDRYELGEEVKKFTLKVINEEESGEKYVGIDRYVGADADVPKKAVLLSFFATYCEPCKREMPYLAALYDFYSDKGLMVLLVTIDKEAEKIDEAKTLAKEAHIRFPVLSDRFNIVAKRYYIEKLPCVYLVNSEGKVAMVNVGYNDDISRDLLDNIRKAVGEPTTEPVPDALARYVAGHAPSETVANSGDSEETADAGDEPAEDLAEAAPAEPPVKGKKKKRKKRKKKRKKKK